MMNISMFNPVNKGNLTVINTNYSMYPASKMANRIRIYNNYLPQQTNDPLSDLKEFITKILNQTSYTTLYAKLTYNITTTTYNAYLPEISRGTNMSLEIKNVYNKTTQLFEEPPDFSFSYIKKDATLKINFDSNYDSNIQFIAYLVTITPNNVVIVYQLSYS